MYVQYHKGSAGGETTLSFRMTALPLGGCTAHWIHLAGSTSGDSLLIVRPPESRTKEQEQKMEAAKGPWLLTPGSLLNGHDCIEQ